MYKPYLDHCMRLKYLFWDWYVVGADCPPLYRVNYYFKVVRMAQLYPRWYWLSKKQLTDLESLKVSQYLYFDRTPSKISALGAFIGSLKRFISYNSDIIKNENKITFPWGDNDSKKMYWEYTIENSMWNWQLNKGHDLAMT